MMRRTRCDSAQSRRILPRITTIRDRARAAGWGRYSPAIAMKVGDDVHTSGGAPSAAGVPPHSGSLRADRGSVNAGRAVSTASAPLADSKQPDQASPATIVVYTVAFVVLTVLSNVYRKKMYNAYGTKYTCVASCVGLADPCVGRHRC